MDITPLILTYNEAPNIARVLERLAWAPRIVVVDSFSTDETLAICRKFQQVEIVQRKFDDHTTQWNFGFEQIKTEWVLTLDADYVLSDELVSELESLPLAAGPNAYFAAFYYCVLGRPLSASLYPPRAVLCRLSECRYEPDGHTQKLAVRGDTGHLRGVIRHDDRKPLDRWFAEQLKYSALEARHLLAAPREQLNRADRLRLRILFAPFVVFGYTLLGKRLILDGWPGWYYVLQRTLAEILLSLRLLEARLK